MNRLGLAHRKLSFDAPWTLEITDANAVFKQVRHQLKQACNDYTLGYSNVNGAAARDYWRCFRRYGSHWLEFDLADFVFDEQDYPSDDELQATGFYGKLEACEIPYEESILEEVGKPAKLVVFLGLTETSARSYRSKVSPWSSASAVPSGVLPLSLEILALVVTNAPTSFWVEYRSTILL